MSIKKDKVILPLSYEKVVQIDIKKNTLKNAYLGPDNMHMKLPSSGAIKTFEDDNHDLYFASDFVVYKTDSMLKVIKSKDITNDIQEVEPNTNIDKIENTSLPYFFNKELDIFKYKIDESVMESKVKLGDKFLIVNNNNFKIVDSL